MLRRLLIISLPLMCQGTVAQEADSVQVKRPGLLSRALAVFDNYDTAYIEPNHYSWAFMLQNTNTFEMYNIRTRSNDSRLNFSPSPGVKIGPYLGWKFLFLGYTIDLRRLGKTASKKTEFELCLYTSRVGCDIIYRRTGDDYRINVDNEYIDAQGAVKVGIVGANLYYIFNHRHFSYPAAMSQSTVQRRSAGSFMAGASITRHSMDFDYRSLSDISGVELDNSLCFDKLKYTDYSLSFGYGYNWVFKRNWLLCVSAMPAVGYKHLSGDLILPSQYEDDERPLATRIGNTFNVDFTMRASLVWNNTKYFGGVALVMHTYRYRHDNIFINNTFGNVAVYWGLNFKKKKGH